MKSALEQPPATPSPGSLSTILRSAVQRGHAAARANLLPALLLQAFGISLLVAYYQVDPFKNLLSSLAQWKTEVGFLYAIIATALAGGLFPWILRKLFVDPSAPLSDLYFYTIFWAIKGFEIDLFYRAQARLFGEGLDWQTVLSKVAFDQFVYVPLWAAPSIIVAYTWYESRRDHLPLPWKKQPPLTWFLRDGVPILLANWAVWIPAVFIIYLLPLPLQLPIQNLILCFWVLILTILTARQQENPPSQPPGK
ncbi:MAG: hypothetical protein ACFCU4_01125 [Puniceicoccaceae bacterium]